MARVLRVPDHDGDGFVILYLNSTADGASHPLDLTILGTDNDSPYRLALNKSTVSALRARNSPCNQDEWEAILEYILLGKTPGDDYGNLLARVEAVASTKTEQYIEIIIRKRTEGITQRIGSFLLASAESLEIDLFDWCGVAVQANTAILRDLDALKVRYQEQGEAIDKLNTQLEELVDSKARHETELLEKFRDLLNEKKSKIRDQQRLLAAPRNSSQKLTEFQAPHGGKKARKVGSSRPGKRKAEVNDEPESSEDKAFDVENVDVDVDQVAKDSGQDTRETTDDDETADEDNGADISPVRPEVTTRGHVSAAGEKETRGEIPENATGINSNEVKAKEDPPTPPPRRDLPFAKKHITAAKESIQEDDDTASEDDEL